MKLPGVRPSVRLSVRPIVRPPHAAAASLLLSAPPAGDIDRLPHGRLSAATASGVTAACPIQTNFLRQTLFQHCSTICLELSPCLRSEL